MGTTVRTRSPPDLTTKPWRVSLASARIPRKRLVCPQAPLWLNARSSSAVSEFCAHPRMAQSVDRRALRRTVVYDFEMTDQSSAQAVERFYELLLKATSVRVIAGSSISSKRKNDKLLFLATDVVALSELRDALRVRPLGAQLHVMTPGDPTLVFIAGKDTLLTVQYLGGDPDLVRSDVLGEDALLTGRDALTAWLSKYGNNHGDLG
jgi:hypothetical protein